MPTPLRRPTLTALLGAPFALALAACGDDDSGSDQEATKTSTTDSAAQAADLDAIKGYLLEHTERLNGDTAAIRSGAEDYYQLAKEADFVYERLLRENRAEVRSFVTEAQDAFRKANPSYEEMEGVVAGVPSLADYDVIIDAGSDASDPENAVPFDLKTPDGRTFKQPGNFNYLIETSAFGTEKKFQAKGVKADLDGDGKVEFGESVPDAGFYLAAAREFERYANELDGAAREWKPTPSDALTSLVVMTPTMSEYFEAWKNSRFIAGDQASETAFVAASRLEDIEDILSGLETVYGNVQPLDGEGRPPAGTPDRAEPTRSCGSTRPTCAPVRPPGSSSPRRRPTSSGLVRRSRPRRSPGRSPRRRPS